MKPVIYYPPTLDFNFMKQRPQQILLALSNLGFKIIFSNKNSSESFSVNENFEVVSTNYKWLKDPEIVLASWAKFHDIKTTFPHSFLIYDCVDGFEEWENYENAIIPEADLILAVSTLLRKKLKQKTEKPVYLVSNGCDFSFWNTKANNTGLPLEFLKSKQANKKIILYIGALAWWLDEKIIKEFVKLEKCDFYFIGCKFNNTLPKSQNIFYLGEKKYFELLKFAQHCDTLIVPFNKALPVARYSDPIKVYEYCATGKPIITTALPVCLEHTDFLYVANSDKEFLQYCEEVCEVKDYEKQIGFAKENSWENKAKMIKSLILKNYKKR